MRNLFLIITILFSMSASPCSTVIQNLLGGVVDQGQIWLHSGNTNWTEAGYSQSWRISHTPTATGKIKVTACPHIRSGDGSGRSRLYHKFRIVKLAPSYNPDLALNAEALVELLSGNNIIRFLDNSRCWTVLDENPVINQVNTYAVEVVAGDSVRVEISYGSPLILEFIPN